MRYAWRGRRRGDGAACRRCEYDLRGRPDGSSRCPECGSDLTAPDAIALGSVKRRTTIVATLFVVTLLVGSMAIISSIRWGRTFNWLPYAPTRWVIADTRSVHWDKSGYAVDELARRAIAHTLMTADVPAILSAEAAGRQFPRNPDWATVMENLRLAGLLSDTDWHDYANVMVQFLIRTPRRIEAGLSPKLEIRIDGYRSLGSAEFRGKWLLRKLTINGALVDGLTMSGDYLRSNANSIVNNGKAALPRLKGGVNDVVVVIDVERSASPDATKPVKPADAWHETLTLKETIEVIDLKSATTRELATYRKAMASEIVVLGRRTPTGTEIHVESKEIPFSFAGSIVLQGLPPDIAGKVPQYDVNLPQGGFSSGSFTYPVALPSPLSIEFRPDPDRTPDTDVDADDGGPLWPESIRLSNIPIFSAANRP